MTSGTGRTEAQNQAASPPGPQTHWLIACAAAIALLSLLWFASVGWAAVIYGALTDGILAILWVVSATGWGLWGVRWVSRGMGGVTQNTGGPPVPPPRQRAHQQPATRNPQPSTALHFVSAAGLGLGLMSLLFLALGLLGWMSRPAVLVVLAIGWTIALLVGISRLRSAHGALTLPTLPTRWTWLWLAVAPIAGLALAGVMAPPGILWPSEPNGYDVVEYHLQVPREWYDTGRVMPLEHNVFSYMPFNVEMHYLAAMELRGGPWAGMYLAQYLHLAFLVLAIVAVYAIGTEIAGPAAGTLAAVATAALPWITMLGTIAYDEGGLLLWGTLAIGWVMRGFISPGSQHTPTQGSVSKRALCLAGLFAGFACGAKLTAVPMVLLAIPVAAVVTALGIQRIAPNPKSKIQNPKSHLALFLLAGLVAFAPWLIRNQFWAGNPVYPELMPLLGPGHFSAVQVQRYQQAHAPRPEQRSISGRAQALWEQVIAEPAYGYALWPLGILGGIWGIGCGRRRETVFLLLLLGILLLIWVGFTHLQSRFFILAIPVAALLIAAAPWGRYTLLPGVIVLAMALGGLKTLGTRFPTGMLEGVYGLQSFRGFYPEAVETAVYGASATDVIGLAGDAKAFFYQIPSRRLRYRTVFDVNAQPGQDLVSAWLGGAKVDKIVIDPGELERLKRTYFGLPPVPEQVMRHGKMYVQPAGQAPD